jgi:hypothetical protein
MHTFWTTQPGVDRPGGTAGIPRWDVNIVTDGNAEDHETERTAAASGPPSSPTVTTVKVSRVYDRTTDQDGNRVLVDRLWPRRISKPKADINEWCKQVAPSTALRKWYNHDPQRSLNSGAATRPNSPQGSTQRPWRTCASWRQTER